MNPEAEKDPVEALTEAGVIVGPLSAEYEEALRSLPPEQVQVIMEVKQRLFEAGEAAGKDPHDDDDLRVSIVI